MNIESHLAPQILILVLRLCNIKWKTDEFSIERHISGICRLCVAGVRCLDICQKRVFEGFHTNFSSFSLPKSRWNSLKLYLFVEFEMPNRKVYDDRSGWIASSWGIQKSTSVIAKFVPTRHFVTLKAT